MDEDAIGRIIELCDRGQEYAGRLLSMNGSFDVRGVREYREDLARKREKYALSMPAKGAMFLISSRFVFGGR